MCYYKHKKLFLFKNIVFFSFGLGEPVRHNNFLLERRVIFFILCLVLECFLGKIIQQSSGPMGIFYYT